MMVEKVMKTEEQLTEKLLEKQKIGRLVFDKKVRDLIEYHLEHIDEIEDNTFIMELLALDVEYMHLFKGNFVDGEFDDIDLSSVTYNSDENVNIDNFDDEIDIENIKIPAHSDGTVEEGLHSYISSAKNHALTNDEIITHLMIEYMNDTELVAKLEILAEKLSHKSN